jgi:uncharacterized protein YceK
MRRTLLALALAALPLAGCGAVKSSQSNFKGEAGKVAAVVDDLANDGRTGNAKKICTDLLAKRLVQEFKSSGGDCQTEMKAAIQDASDFDLRVNSVKVSGTNATALVQQGSHGKTATFSFVKENGSWRASALGG